MKYILMRAGNKADWDAYGTWPEKDIQAYSAFVNAFNKSLIAS
jgi:hypothetical protein